MSPWISSPCCCLNSKTGALLIGIHELIVWSIVLTLSAMCLSTVSGLMTEMTFDGNEQPIKNPLYNIFVMLILCITLSIVRVINGSILLLGIHRNSMTLLKSWLCIKTLAFCITLGTFASITLKGLATFYVNLVFGISFLTSVYFIYVIHSVFHQMKKETNQKQLNSKLQY